ncbi:hypothetical protein NHH03_02170 [Stieleria sp. TO1_6]|uniref:acyl carrier protein n=1 Tax=Stieleria tagensis TaxID=2956795 RepID=UPI00209A8A28|nr:hypothetical protein [Stieleria tagensis]MCO8120528.1 hypothetical protein [Stieleria tagensis]
MKLDGFLIRVLMDPYCITLITVAVFTTLVILSARRSRRSFNERWPSLSDEEFVAKCSPGVSPDTALRVRRIISEQLGIPYDRIHPDQDFVRDLDC